LIDDDDGAAVVTTTAKCGRAAEQLFVFGANISSFYFIY